MVLHNISNDAEFVEISATTLSTKRLLEGNLNVVYVVSVPGSTKELITKTKNQDILHHFFSEVVIDTEKLILLPIRFQRLL